MEKYVKEWQKTHKGYADKVTDYSFEFHEGVYSLKEPYFKEVCKYTVMLSYFFKNKK